MPHRELAEVHREDIVKLIQISLSTQQRACDVALKSITFSWDINDVVAVCTVDAQQAVQAVNIDSDRPLAHVSGRRPKAIYEDRSRQGDIGLGEELQQE
jgi:hypothetical protein